MRKYVRSLLCGIIAVALLASSEAYAVAQDGNSQESSTTTDFSGIWSMQGGGLGGGRGRGRGGARGGRGGRGQVQSTNIGAGLGQKFSLFQDDDELTIERVLYTRSDMQPHMKLRFALDGSESTNTLNYGRGEQELVSTAAWDGESLVITTTREYEDPQSGETATYQVKQTFTLSRPGGNSLAFQPTLRIETEREGVLGLPASVTRATYSRE